MYLCVTFKKQFFFCFFSKSSKYLKHCLLLTKKETVQLLIRLGRLKHLAGVHEGVQKQRLCFNSECASLNSLGPLTLSHCAKSVPIF